MTAHLWDVKHAYYCNEGNYYSNDCGFEYKSWQDFLAEMGNLDMDYNLLFRWDWVEEDAEGEPNYNGDPNYRNGTLKLFWMHQRKGRFIYNTVEVCRNDEPAVIAYLTPFWQHLRDLWAPLPDAKQESA